MKKLIALIGLLAITATAQPTNPPIISLEQTNVPAPVQQAFDIVNFLATTTTNWMFAGYGIYDFGSHSAGAGIAALYKLNDYMAPTIRFDWLDGQLWQPSGTFTLQAPLKLFGKVTAIPFGFGGIATPISGQGDLNGRIASIYGAGLAVRVSSKFDIVADWEQWSVLSGSQGRLGLLFRF